MAVTSLFECTQNDLSFCVAYGFVESSRSVLLVFGRLANLTVCTGGNLLRGSGRFVFEQFFGKIIGLDPLILPEYDRPLERILQLANVTRPIVALQHRESSWRDTPNTTSCPKRALLQ